MYGEEFDYLPNSIYNPPYEYPIIPSITDHLIYESDDEANDQFSFNWSENWKLYLAIGIGSYLVYAAIIIGLFLYYYASKTREKEIKRVQLERDLQNEVRYIRP